MSTEQKNIYNSGYILICEACFRQQNKKSQLHIQAGREVCTCLPRTLIKWNDLYLGMDPRLIQLLIKIRYVQKPVFRYTRLLVNQNKINKNTYNEICTVAMTMHKDNNNEWCWCSWVSGYRAINRLLVGRL